MKIIGFDEKTQRVFFEAETGTQYSVKVGDSINDIVAEELTAQHSVQPTDATPCEKCGAVGDNHDMTKHGFTRISG